MDKTAIIIPAYNEEGTIKRILVDVDKAMKEKCNKKENQGDNQNICAGYDIIVVNDCSKDDTLKIVNSLKKKIKNLGVFSNEKNMGKTRTLLHGIEKSTSGIIVFIDADYQQDPKDIPHIIEQIKHDGADICCGKRINRKDSFYRKFISFFFNLFNRAMFGIRIDDINCGLKGFRKEVFKNMTIKYPQAKWFFDTELLGRAYAKGMKVTQADVRHYLRTEGVSKINGLKAAAETVFYGILLKIDLIFNR